MALSMNLPTMLMACQQQQRRPPYASCDALLAFGVAVASASVAAVDDVDDDENDLGVGIVAAGADTNSIRDSHLHSHDYLCRIESAVCLHWPLDARISAVDCCVAFSAAYSSRFSPLSLVFVHSRLMWYDCDCVAADCAIAVPSVLLHRRKIRCRRVLRDHFPSWHRSLFASLNRRVQ